MKGKEIILQLRDGAYRHVEFLDRKENHRAETAFRTWLQSDGQDGQTYILAKFLTEEITVKETVQKALLTAHPVIEKAGKELKEVTKK